MKTKKINYLLAVCILFTLPFTSCKDDDGNDLLVPANGVSNLSFTDYDIEEGKIGGTLKWTLPELEVNIDDYVIYLGESATDKSHKIGEVSKGTTSFEVAIGTDYANYFLVVARNVTGESANIATLAITDNTGPVVIEPTFTDTDKAHRKIGGTLSWTLPENETGITGYVVYASNDNTKKETKLGEVAAGATSFEVPESTTYTNYLLIVSKGESGESENIASVAVEDEFDEYDGRLYILNGGDWGANNASLSYYDFIKGTITADLYKTANGSSLGDSAEKMLVYGSKIYITVSGSNRLVVLDLNGKLIKSFEPKTEANEPLNPRGIVADNGKVYISYYYGHSIVALDTASLEIGNQLPVGRYPEQLTAANGKIYVANSGGMDPSLGTGDYGKTVSVINPETFTVEKDIEVTINPTEIIADSEGDLYVISMGNYDDIGNTLQRIDGETDEVTVMGSGTTMDLINDHLYVVYGQWGDPDVKFNKYDTKTEELLTDKFATGRTFTGKNTLRIAVDPLTDKIYISDSPYGTTANLLIFKADGTFEKEIDTGGSGVKNMAFLAK